MDAKDTLPGMFSRSKPVAQPYRRGVVQGLSPAGFHSIAYVEWGDPNAARPIVCVHGLTRFNQFHVDPTGAFRQLDRLTLIVTETTQDAEHENFLVSSRAKNLTDRVPVSLRQKRHFVLAKQCARLSKNN
jgi:hypothetical protein